MAVDVVLLGAGNRGRLTYGAFALRHPERMRIVAVAEPDAERRAAVAHEHGLPPERAFEDWSALLAGPQLARAAIVATGDDQHVGPALAAIARGYALLLEKPIAPDGAGCVQVVEAAERAGGVLQIAHPLRFTPFYRRVHEIVASGRLGQVYAIDLREHIAHWHMAHSYVRGKFRNLALAAPILLAKSCHDLDLLGWLVGAPPARVSSFAELSHYRAESAPPGAPERCTDGCPVQAECPHDAVAFYLEPEPARAADWPYADLGGSPSREARRAALEQGRYGRCVYRCDNDVPDHQLVQIAFENGVLASFGLHGFGTRERRTLRASGSLGELRGVFQTGELEISRHGQRELERIRVEAGAAGHYGGDPELIASFLERVERGETESSFVSGRTALEGHLLGFAAERARAEGRVVELRAFRREIAGEGRGSR